MARLSGGAVESLSRIVAEIESGPKTGIDPREEDGKEVPDWLAKLLPVKRRHLMAKREALSVETSGAGR